MRRQLFGPRDLFSFLKKRKKKMKIKFFPSLRTKGEQAIDRMIIAGAAVLMLIGLATEIDRLDNRHVSGVGGRPVGGT